MSEQTKKNSIFSGIARWMRELKSEIKKVVWPTPKQVIKNTLVVIATVLVVGVFVWTIDLAFNAIRQLLMSLAI